MTAVRRFANRGGLALGSDSFLLQLALAISTNVLSLVLGLVSGVAAARLLGVENRGVFALALVILGLLVQLTDLSAIQTVALLVSSGEQTTLGAVWNVSRRAVPASLLCLAALALYLRFAGFGGSALILVVSSAAPFQIVNGCLLGVLLARQPARWHYYRSLPAAGWALSVGAFWVLGLTPPKMVWFGAIYLGLNVVSMFATLAGVWSHLGGIGGGHPVRLKALIPVHIGELVWCLLRALPALAASSLVGARELGLYTVGLGIAAPASAVGSALGSILLPQLLSRAPEDRRSLGRRSLWASTGLTILGSLVLALLSPWLVPVLFGGDYRGATNAAIASCLSQGPIAYAYAMVAILRSEDALWGSTITLSVLVLVEVVLLGLTAELGFRSAAMLAGVGGATSLLACPVLATQLNRRRNDAKGGVPVDA